MFRMLAEVKVFEMLNFFWSRCPVMIFFLVFSGPNFSKLAWIVLLKILMHLKDLNAESEPKVTNAESQDWTGRWPRYTSGRSFQAAAKKVLIVLHVFLGDNT